MQLQYLAFKLLSTVVLAGLALLFSCKSSPDSVDVRNLSYTIDTVLIDSKGQIFLGGERTGIYNFQGELEHRFDWNAIAKENGGIWMYLNVEDELGFIRIHLS